MAIDEQEYKRLKRQAEEAEAEKNRAEGALATAMTRLEEEFGCATMADAKKLLKKLKAEAEAAEAEFESAKNDFEEQWAERLKEE